MNYFRQDILLDLIVSKHDSFLDLMTPKHDFLFESYDFQAVLFFDPYELCGVEWLTSSVGMDIPDSWLPRRGGRCWAPKLRTRSGGSCSGGWWNGASTKGARSHGAPTKGALLMLCPLRN